MKANHNNRNVTFCQLQVVSKSVEKKNESKSQHQLLFSLFFLGCVKDR